MASEMPLSLLVTAGTHAGARMALAGKGMLLVGSTRDCDLCLADADVAAHHLLIAVDGPSVTVRAIAAGARCAGAALKPGQTKTLALNKTLNIGPGVALRLENGRPAPAAPRPGARRYALLAAVLGAAVLAVFLQRSEAGHASGSSQTERADIDGVVAALELGSSLRVEREDDTWTLRGVLDAERRDQLVAALNAAGLAARTETTNVASLLEQVREVFRTNGFRAQVTFVPPAGVQVNNLNAAHPGIAKAAEHVQRDVPELRELTFAGTLPEAPTGSAPTLASLVPGKRLTTIVDGDTAYVAAEDGSRYFPGSVLPGGAQVRQITHEGIQVDQDGELTWLRF